MPEIPVAIEADALLPDQHQRRWDDVVRPMRLAKGKDDSLGRTVLLIGAGCSKTAGIPLAKEIAQQLVKELVKTWDGPTEVANDHSRSYDWLCRNADFGACWLSAPPVEDQILDESMIDWPAVYDTLFASFYNTPDQAREIFSGLVEQAKGAINWAHLCIGELVRSNFVSTVITTNFDQLALAGMVRASVLPVVHDGIESLAQVRGLPNHPQLIELHGSRNTYLLRNSPRDVNALSLDARASAAIHNIFNGMQVFIVVGYGGREKGVMDLLINAARTYYNKVLVWVAHEKSSEKLSEAAKAFLATSKYGHLLLEQDADSFFLNLLKELGVGSPLGIREPLFLAQQHALTFAPHQDAGISARTDIIAELQRHRSEIEMLRAALLHHRQTRSETETMLTNARKLRLQGKLAEAVEALNAAAVKGDDPDLWEALAEMAAEAGKTSPERTSLERAVTALRRLGNAIDRAKDPVKWSEIQDSLGSALCSLSEREAGTEHLEEAIHVYREALTERTRERAPLAWAMTQDNLGTALRRLGEREGGTERLQLAVEAHRAALTERTRDRVPLDWATTQNNLGLVLLSLGKREKDTEQLEQAVAAFREALTERTREIVPLDWGMTQNHLGAALLILGEHENGTARLEQAAAAFRDALTERTRDRVPLDWAATLNNLGGVLLRLADQRNSIEGFKQAIDAFRDALTEYTRERVPLQWASTQNNLGVALWKLGERENDARRLKQAIEAFGDASTEYERAHFTLNWATSQHNLGLVLLTVGKLEKSTQRLEDAVAAFRRALDAYKAVGATRYIEEMLTSLDAAETLLKKRRRRKPK